MYIFKVTLDGQTNTVRFNPDNYIVTAISEANQILVRGNNTTSVVDLGIDRKFVTDFIKDFDRFSTTDFMKIVVDDNKLEVNFKHEITGEIVTKTYTNKIREKINQ